MRASPQQQAVYDWVRTGKGNAIVEAVAGSGKTTTLIGAVELMEGSVAFAAYNKKIATEIQARLEKSTTKARAKAATFHSFGFGAIMQGLKGSRMEDKKMSQLAAQREVPQELRAFALQAVSLAKQSAIGVLTSFNDAVAWQRLVDHYELEDALLTNPFKRDEFSEAELDARVQCGLKHAKLLLQDSVDADKTMFDFDDMIYAPLVHDIRIRQSNWVLIDEAQDTNPSRRAFAKKMLAPGGRLIAVGDPCQAIYGFTGADNDSLDIIQREFDCQRLPLTVTYRCPKAVVSHAQAVVSHITAADSAPEGEVLFTSQGEFEAEQVQTLTGADAILCRNTRPLVELAFRLIKRGIGCHVEGKDIGRGLVNLTKKWKRAQTVADLRDRLEDYLEKETQRLLAKGQEMKAESLSDRVGTLLVIMEGMGEDEPLSAVETRISGIFQDVEPGQPSRTVTLSTVHKSKGREWNRVFLLGRNKYMPSAFARQTWQMDQERNLVYVAITRAMQTLVEVAVAS